MENHEGSRGFSNNDTASKWDTLKTEVSFSEKETTGNNDFVDITECLPEVSERILAATRIPNRDTRPRPGEIVTEDYKKNHLEPKTSIRFEDVEVAVSDIFEAYDHKAVIGYVKSGNEYVARNFYQSNSQGDWRLLPDYAVDEYDRSVWFGKGYSEEMTNLPSALQKALSRLTRKVEIATENEAEKLFCSTARKYDSETYMSKRRRKELSSDAYKEIDSTPAVSFGELSNVKDVPEDIHISKAQMPNFSHEIDSWESIAELYGVLVNRVYASNDDKLRYTFSENRRGMAFISNIEYVSKVTSSGVREKWVSGGDVETPLYEYESQASGYGDASDRKVWYVSMWRNYLSKMEIIKEYLKAQGKDSID